MVTCSSKLLDQLRAKIRLQPTYSANLRAHQTLEIIHPGDGRGIDLIEHSLVKTGIRAQKKRIESLFEGRFSMGIYGDRGDLLFIEHLPGYVIAILLAFVVQIGMQ